MIVTQQSNYRTDPIHVVEAWLRG